MPPAPKTRASTRSFGAVAPARTRPHLRPRSRSPVLVAIVGGSGSGKTWLADKLQQALAPRVTRLSVDSFYLDRSRLSPGRRARLNFDHPRAIDWPALERVLEALLQGQAAEMPRYDFKTHSRLSRPLRVEPRPVILLDGLWVLRKRSIRKQITLSVFLHCAAGLRLRRRILRDQLARGRTMASVKRQFRETVQPMHLRYVQPQAELASVVLTRACSARQVQALARRIRALLEVPQS